MGIVARGDDLLDPLQAAVFKRLLVSRVVPLDDDFARSRRVRGINLNLIQHYDRLILPNDFVARLQQPVETRLPLRRGLIDEE